MREAFGLKLEWNSSSWIYGKITKPIDHTTHHWKTDMKPMGKDASLGNHIFLGIKTSGKRVVTATENHSSNYKAIGHIRVKMPSVWTMGVRNYIVALSSCSSSGFAVISFRMVMYSH